MIQLWKTGGLGQVQWGIMADGVAKLPRTKLSLSDVLHSKAPWELARNLSQGPCLSFQDIPTPWLPPLDHQEVWAAGVTYLRSREARERESTGAAHFYDLVYTASRPELFFKATAARVIAPLGVVRVRQDSKWTVPEPELALVISPELRIVGYTIGNDMSARDIEGENPLYLPQAKIYNGSCALGPVITLVEDFPEWESVGIRLTIDRQGSQAFSGSTTLAAMRRKPEELVQWLGRENSFPNGCVLLTGTGVVPPDDFGLRSGDTVHIEIDGIGRLTNRVEQS